MTGRGRQCLAAARPAWRCRGGGSPVAIVCGGGSLPVTVADALTKQGRSVVLFPLHGWADPALVARYPHHWIHIGQFGRFFRLARSEGCRDLMLIGTLVRPPIRHTPARLGNAARDAAHHPRLSRAAMIICCPASAASWRITDFACSGAHEVAPEILAAPGCARSSTPRPQRDKADIARALALLAAIGPFDVGQAAVVANGHVLAVEAAEGTDHMLAHIAEMRRAGRIRSPARCGRAGEGAEAEPGPALRSADHWAVHGAACGGRGPCRYCGRGRRGHRRAAGGGRHARRRGQSVCCWCRRVTGRRRERAGT